MITVANSNWSEQRDEHLKSKTKSCQSRRKKTEVEWIFQEYAWTLP